jgi:hypothetical protein
MRQSKETFLGTVAGSTYHGVPADYLAGLNSRGARLNAPVKKQVPNAPTADREAKNN